MADHLLQGDSLDEIESLVRDAGRFVRPSQDLRPRTLESARAACHERWAQRRLWQLTLVVAIIATLTQSLDDRLEVVGLHQGRFSPAAGHGTSSELAPAPSDAGWTMVDSFTDLRRRQAEMLRLAK
jgi:hypothetical protein